MMSETVLKAIATDAIRLAAEIMRQSPDMPFLSVDQWIAGAMPGIIACEIARERS